MLNTFLPAVPKLKYLSSKAPVDIKKKKNLSTKHEYRPRMLKYARNPIDLSAEIIIVTAHSRERTPRVVEIFSRGKFADVDATKKYIRSKRQFDRARAQAFGVNDLP